MIKLNNVSKIYDGISVPVKALNNVSLEFDSKGLTFILGKSGSGKSTLLNMIGLLDKPTSGEIVFKNSNYQSLKELEKDYIRNFEIGFVFQNFNLINEFNVYDNLAIILDLKTKEEKDELISKALKMVDLEGYELRFPQELSAGQQQRIAIARALVKNPKVILADEPTGNVDSKTAKIILDLFKKISEDILVILVSHNESDSIKYSDRLIELADGEVIRDETKVANYQNELVITNDQVILPYRILSDEEILKLNENSLENKTVSVNSSGFIPTKLNIKSDEHLTFTKEKLNNSIKYSYKLYKNRLVTNILTNFIISFIVSVIIIATFFFNFNMNEKYEEAIVANDLPIVLYSPRSDTISRRVSAQILSITDSKYQALVNSQAKVYPVYNIGSNHSSTNLKSFGYKDGNVFNMADFGLAIVDEDYLTEIFGTNIEYIYENSNDVTGVIITDFMLYSSSQRFKVNSQNLNVLIEEFETNHYLKIHKIIKTNFENKYEGYYDENGKIHLNDLTIEQVNYLYDEVNYKYLIHYTTNENFIDDYFNTYYEEQQVWRNPMNVVQVDAYNLSYELDGNSFFQEKNKLKFHHEITEPDQIIMQLNQFNEVFGTNYNSHSEIDLNNYRHIPITLKATIYEGDVPKEIEEIVYLKRLGTMKAENFFYISPLNETLKKATIQRMAVLVPPSSNTEYLNVLEQNDLIIYNTMLGIYNDVSNVVKTFAGVFNFLRIVLVITTLIIILVLAINMSRRNKRFLGILKCFGAKRFDLTKIFFLQTIFNILIISFFIVIGTKLGTNIANLILEKGLNKYMRVNITNFNLITISWPTSFLYLLITISIFLLSVLIPVIRIKNINPIEIVKANE